MKCNKVKNPCKICFQPVSKKNGLQCQGACQKWAHYNCLNYTPGKIQDIKAGVIKITCPCPDCNITEPKELLADPPFTCTNTQCPANKLPVCGSIDCPANPIPIYPPFPFESSPVPTSPCPPPRTPPCAPPRTPPCAPPRTPPCAPPRTPPCAPPRTPPCALPRTPPSAPPKKPPCAAPRTPPSNTPPRCPSPKPKPPRIPTPPNSNPPVCPETCLSHQKQKNTKKLFLAKQSQSCSDVSNESSSSGRPVDKMRTASSDSKLPAAGVDPKVLFSAIESLCNTVGQLSNQLKNLMCKIQLGYGK